MSSDKTDLNKGRVSSQLARVSAPMTLGIFSVLAVGLADAFFLARVGATELAAVGFVYPVTVAITAFSVGLSAGANTTLSQARGGNKDDRAVSRLTLHACLAGLALSLGIAGLFWVVAPAIFNLLGAKAAVHDAIMAYLPYWIASFPFLVVTMILNAAFRAAGDGFTAAGTMVTTAIVNIALTPALIFGVGPIPAMGMAGAGLGTLLARLLGLLLAVYLIHRAKMLTIGRTPFKGMLASVREIFGIAFPAAMSRAINPIGMALVTAAVATLGDAAVAGFGAATRIEAIALVPFFALASGLSPVVGQSWGAGDDGRARAAMRAATVFCLIYGLALSVTLFAFAEPLARFMVATDEPTAFTADYLRIVGLTVGGYGLSIAANAAMTGRSRASWAMGLNLSRITLIYVPLAWLGVVTLGYNGILAAAVLANIGSLWGALIATHASRIGPSNARIVSGPSAKLSRALPDTPPPDGR